MKYEPFKSRYDESLESSELNDDQENQLKEFITGENLVINSANRRNGQNELFYKKLHSSDNNQLASNNKCEYEDMIFSSDCVSTIKTALPDSHI